MTKIHLIRSYSREFFMSVPKMSFIIAMVTLCFLSMLASPASAAPVLQVTPLSWNVIGLDSNSPFAGPYRFPVGARVCNTGSSDAGDVTATLVWDSANAGVNLRGGSLSSIPFGLIAAGVCADAYFEVEVDRATAPYDTARLYHITASDSVSGATGTSPQPRELYVEHLISQNRNSVTDIKLNGTSVPAGGSMTLMVGSTYTIELDGGTTTQGYNQFEAFIDFSNAIFQILSVTTTYSADNSPYVPSPNDRLYADACLWENDPNSPNYRSCIGGDYRAGGSNVVTTYIVKIIGGGGTSQTLNSLLYDFSGSSYHYNGDYTVGARIANIIGPSSVTIAKSFTPRAITPGGTSVMSFKLANPTAETFTGVNFTDSFPAGLKVAATPGVTYDGCGAGAISPAPVVDGTSISFSGGTLSPNSICTISVNVTAAAGTYSNTSGHLFIDTSIDTGNVGSDTLTASSGPPCTPGQTLVSWTVPVGATNPPDTLTGGAGSPTTNNTGFTATASAGVPGSTSIDNIGQNDTASWLTYGYQTGNYVQFAVDTRNYSGVKMSFQLKNASVANGPTIMTVSYDNGSGFSTLPAGTLTLPANTNWTAKGVDFTGLTNTIGMTTFRIAASGAKNDNRGAGLNYDVITFTGCALPTPPPTITKTFLSNPIIKGNTSVLSFTINNAAAGNKALTGVAFTDVLPAGLSVNDSSSSQCGGTLTTDAATRTISLAGGSLAADGSCIINITVTGTVEGQYDNVSGYISSTQSGTSTNYATASLTVVAPPVLAKSFSPSSILVGGASTLTFAVSNTNQIAALNNIGFTDTLPAGVTVANSGPAAICGGSLTTTSPSSISFTGGTLGANTSCTFSVPVTGMTEGTKNNVTSAITSTEGGNGNAASATLAVSNPVPLIGLNKEVSTDNTNWFKFVGMPLPLPHNLYYRFTVSNEGETALSTVVVTDPNVTVCALPASLAVGASASCVVGPLSIVSIPVPDPFINTATITTSTYTPTTPVTSAAKYGIESLSLAKSVTENYFIAGGDVLHYSYLVTNTGGYPLLGPVTVSDSKATVTCPAVSTVGDGDDYLDPGEGITCTATYMVQTADVTAKSVINTASATVAGTTSPPDSKTVNMKSDLSVVKINNVSGNVDLGNTFIWTLTASNSAAAGPALFANGQTLLVDDLPAAGATYSVGTVLSAGGTIGAINCSISSNTLTCAANGVVTIPSGGSFSVTVTVTPTTAGTLLNPRAGGNCAVDPAGAVPELDEANNNCVPNTVTVTPGADLSITKTDSATTAVPGQGVTYLITVTNNGPSNVSGASVVDTMPSVLTNVSWTCTATAGSSCPASGNGNINHTVNLLNGGAATYTVTATVSASAVGTLTNTATVTAPAGITDPVPGNNSATDTDTLTLLADVTTTVTPPATASAGSKVNVPASFTNNGPSTASTVIYSAQLPGGLSGVTCSGATCSYNNVTGVVTITGLSGTLASGQTVNMTLSYTAPSSGTVDVATTISTSTPESNIVNNSASGSTTINQKAVMVPTLNEWGLILFALLLGLVSVYKMRRRGYA